jgi:hypothetical protein
VGGYKFREPLVSQFTQISGKGRVYVMQPVVKEIMGQGAWRPASPRKFCHCSGSATLHAWRRKAFVSATRNGCAILPAITASTSRQRTQRLCGTLGRLHAARPEVVAGSTENFFDLDDGRISTVSA